VRQRTADRHELGCSRGAPGAHDVALADPNGGLVPGGKSRIDTAEPGGRRSRVPKPPECAKTQAGRVRALVVGIDHYPRISDVKGAINDAKLLATALRQHGAEVLRRKISTESVTSCN
jgi:hypothetical protein